MSLSLCVHSMIHALLMALALDDLMEIGPAAAFAGRRTLLAWRWRKRDVYLRSLTSLCIPMSDGCDKVMDGAVRPGSGGNDWQLRREVGPSIGRL